ncbi:MAG TPA: type II toxin-antitoxin system PemK/MazF family toxin, partial [Candidatus Nanoarchaeia archaeon]|nr:type II toxin-antitoxin system PemK/MazF family toxin [Candidatus Nanoarchaeia archaeon]
MLEVKRGEVWLVNLDPTIGHEIKKTRPGVIIQNDIGNKYSPITIIAPVTSQNVEKVYPVEVFLPKRISGLKEDSKLLLNHIRA